MRASTLLRELQAACSQYRFAAHAVPLRKQGTCRMVIYSIRSDSHKFEPLERYPLPTSSEILPRPFLRPLFIELAPAFNSERSRVENLYFPVIPTMLDHSVATLEVLPPNSDSHPARALILPANFLEVTQPRHGTEAVDHHELVRNLEADVVHRHFGYPPVGLVEQDGNLERTRPAGLQEAVEVVEGESGVEDVFNRSARNMPAPLRMQIRCTLSPLLSRSICRAIARTRLRICARRSSTLSFSGWRFLATTTPALGCWTPLTLPRATSARQEARGVKFFAVAPPRLLPA